MKEILIRNEYVDLEKILPSFKDVILSAIEMTAEVLDYSLEGKEVSVLLTGDAEIHKLNREFRDKDFATNVLSFETCDDVMLGDIVVSIDTVLRECEEQSKEFKNHFTHLIIHGVLHLLGYDHLDDEDAEEMEAFEVEIMGRLGLENPY